MLQYTKCYSIQNVTVHKLLQYTKYKIAAVNKSNIGNVVILKLKSYWLKFKDIVVILNFVSYM
jgi:hypothetical protein